jgi:DNA-binding response OmpR family regulator
VRRGAPLVLVVEDDDRVATTVGLYVEHEGFRLRRARDGAEALAAFADEEPDVVVLDLGLPGLDGREVCRRMRRASDVSILMLTARVTEQDVIDGLDLGADDYVTKPFSPRQLMARIRAAVRRRRDTVRSEPLRFGGLEIDAPSRRVTVGGREVRLTGTEFDLLRTLAGTPGRVYSRSELVDRVLAPGFDGSDRTVDAHVKNLRRRLRERGGVDGVVETVVGVGYRFVAPAAPVD